MGKPRNDVMESGKVAPLIKESRWANSASEATAFAEACRSDPSLAFDYYEVNWYLYRLDEVQRSATEQGKHPAAVSALRTMAELVGLVGPQVGSIDVRTQVLALPEGISEETLLALATLSIVSNEA